MSVEPSPPVQPDAPLVRVLFADDSAAIRTLARLALTARQGCQLVGEAADGDDVLAQLDSCRPDCVVLDIEMPGTNGFAALAELRRRAREVPVVMLSGSTDPETRRRALNEGAAAYLGKGDITQLARTVRQVTSAAASPSPPAAAPAAAPAEPAPVAPTAAAPTPAASTPAAAPTGGPGPDPQQEAARVTAELRRLEYLVSHDFAEPARILKGFATLLADGYADALDARGQAFLTHITAATERLQGMIDDLLVFSRAGRAEPMSEVVELDSCAAEVRRQLVDDLTARGAVLEVGCLPRVLGDASALTTVLRHLVSNGLLFNRSPVPRLELTGRRLDDQVVVTVTDNGIGVPPARVEEVFELFRRLTAREEHPGTGTGLALCRRLVEQQQGTITLAAARGGGSVVTLTLPAAPG